VLFSVHNENTRRSIRFTYFQPTAFSISGKILICIMVRNDSNRDSQVASSSVATSVTIYFGYGSNLWLRQMRQRCPTSEYRGVARLNGFRWIINDRGYANVVQEKDAKAHHVYGLVYSLQPEDEARLDVNEGVPYAYTKEWLEVEFWSGNLDVNDGKVDLSQKPEKLRMLVYIDRNRLTDDKPKEEYIYRMNMGIKDAIHVGVPENYIQKNLRPFIPAESSKDVEEFANKQAVNFEDEN
jgi:gamma-glutamylcyclotransferase